MTDARRTAARELETQYRAAMAAEGARRRRGATIRRRSTGAVVVGLVALGVLQTTGELLPWPARLGLAGLIVAGLAALWYLLWTGEGRQP